MCSKGGSIIENKVLKLKKLMQSADNIILKDIIKRVLDLDIKDIIYDKNLELTNMSEYEFELVKVKAILENEEEVEMYLKMIKNTRIKESIFCYWCSIYEEELIKTNELENMDIVVNKVSISELEKSKYQNSVFLMIEDNQTTILQTGTEINFIELNDYIRNNKNEKNQYEKLYEYFDENCDDVLLVGIKMNRIEE